jgi:hypothetical protein
MRNMLTNLPRRRLVIVLVAATAVFGAVFAFAASLGVSSASLGAGDAVVSSCDTNGVSASYSTTYSSGYKVSAITVSGIAAACDGKTVSATLTGTGANLPQTVSLGTYVDGTDNGSKSANISGANQPLASDVTGAAGLISG